MLKCFEVATSEEKWEILKEFDPRQHTLVVSDLRSKFFIQSRFLQNYGFIEEDCLLRASELWRRILIRWLPDYRIISQDLAMTLLGQFLREVKPKDQAVEKLAQTIFQYMNALVTVLSHPEGDELIRDWFIENPVAFQRWGVWYEWCVRAWEYFLQRKMLPAAWVSGVLVNEIGFESIWNRPLYFDLGAELDSTEAELLINLSRFLDIVVIKPVLPTHLQNDNRWKFLFKSYEAFATVTQKINISNEKSVKLQYKQFSTMLAEVKQAVAQFRQWADVGVAFDKMAFVAPDIEKYWACLEPYLRLEGLPYDKDVTSRLCSWPIFLSWLSHLRLQQGIPSTSDLESDLYSFHRKPIMTYEKFKVLYSALYDRDDLGRNEEVKDIFQIYSDQQLSKLMHRDQMVAYCLKFWPDPSDTNAVKELLLTFLSECPETIELSYGDWLKYLESLIRRQEIVLQKGTTSGIRILNVISTEASLASHVVLVGLTDENLRKRRVTQILHSDVLSLAQATGFQLPHIDQNILEFETYWLMKNQGEEICAYLAQTDFDGQPQAPASVWLEGGENRSILDLPEKTRWDEIQMNVLNSNESHLSIDQDSAQLLQSQIRQDQGIEEFNLFPVTSVKRFSASGVEDFWKCPFLWTAKNLLRLSDLPSLDLDTDKMTTGQLLHSILEKIVRNYFIDQKEEINIAELLEECRREEKIQLADDRLWVPLKKRLQVLSERFLQFEIKWRAQFPELKTLDCELETKGWYEPSVRKWHKEKVNPQCWSFYGVIDRIDVDVEKRTVLLDYKSSAFELQQVGNWIEKGQFQLLLYTLALEFGFTKYGPLDVDGAFYFIPKKLDRSRGFRLEEHPETLFDFTSKHKNKISLDKKRELLKKTEEQLESMIQTIEMGQLGPKPHNTKVCDFCKWSDICRAPHLN